MPRSTPAPARLRRARVRSAGLTLALVALVAPVALVACADDPSDVRPVANPVGDAPSAPVPAIVPVTTVDTAAGSPGSDASGDPVVVQALDNTFRPDTVTVAVGTPVRFDNVGRNDHDVIPVIDGEEADAPTTGPDGWGVAAEDFVPGDRYTHVFDRPGVYEYVCTIHGVAGVGMIGTVTVTP
jgi:plastocyanin